MADIDQKEFEKIKKLAGQLKSASNALHTEYREIEQMYQMRDDVNINSASHDKGDIKITISPSARNAVVGVVRLLTSSEPRFKCTSESGSEKVNEIEKLAKKMWKESSAFKRAPVWTDAVRTAVLFSDVHLTVDCVDDLLKVAGMDEGERMRLNGIRKRTPFLFAVRHPIEGYPYFGEHGMRAYYRLYQTTGDEIKSRWGEPAGSQFDDNTQYNVNDWYDLTQRIIWMDNNTVMVYAKHKMPELPIDVQLADGSELWTKPEEMRQPFLYASWKGGWWKRENLVYTSIFTSMAERGTGILLGFDEEPNNITVEFAGPGVRYIKAAKPRMLSDTALDPSLIAVKNQILEPIEGENTIYKQTLGQDVGNNTFSSLSLLSQTGRLPIVPMQEAVQHGIERETMVVMRWIKREGIDLEGIVDMKASDIPDDLELTVELKVDLPQDMFRNVQIAEQAVDKQLVSREWVHTNLLDVPDSEAMTKQIWGEKAVDAFFSTAMQMAIQKASQPPAPPTTPAPTPDPNAPPPAMPPTQPGDVPDQMQGQGVSMPGGPASAMAGGGAMPATEPMTPGPMRLKPGGRNGAKPA